MLDETRLECSRKYLTRIWRRVDRNAFFFRKKSGDPVGDRFSDREIGRCRIERRTRRCRGVRRAIDRTAQACDLGFWRVFFAFRPFAALHHAVIRRMQRRPRQHATGERKDNDQQCKPLNHFSDYIPSSDNLSIKKLSNVLLPPLASAISIEAKSKIRIGEMALGPIIASCQRSSTQA